MWCGGVDPRELCRVECRSVRRMLWTSRLRTYCHQPRAETCELPQVAGVTGSDHTPSPPALRCMPRGGSDCRLLLQLLLCQLPLPVCAAQRVHLPVQQGGVLPGAPAPGGGQGLCVCVRVCALHACVCLCILVCVCTGMRGGVGRRCVV